VAAPGAASRRLPVTAADVTAAPAKSPRQMVLHEVFTVVLSAVILGLTAWMMARTFASSAATFSGDEKLAALQKDAYERQKDIMLYGMALLGTVTGYYLGRIPAERRADSAQRSADKAHADAQHAVMGAAAEVARAVDAKDAAKKAARTIVRRTREALGAAGHGPAGRAALGPRSTSAPPDFRAAEAAMDDAERLLEDMG
jgi:membrane protein YqaA with SNARE-associated domain